MVAAAVGVAALAGCGSSSRHSSSDTTSSTATASTVAAGAPSGSDGPGGSDTASPNGNQGTTDPQAYLQAVHGQPHFQGLSDTNLDTLGTEVCQDFSKGATLDQTENDALHAVNDINASSGGDLDAQDAGFVIGAAVKELCPQYSDQLPGG